KSIKSTEVSIAEQTKTLSDLIFNEVIQTKQFRFEDNKQQYQFARKIDGALAIGQDTELAINVISPFHEHFGNELHIKSHSMGNAEMLVLLGEDKSLMADLLMYLKTDRYCKTHSIADANDTERSILREKGETNQKRRAQIRRSIEDLLKGAKLIVNNSEMEITGDGVSRLSDGFQHLVRSSYPNLKMLKGHPTYQETDLNKYLFDDIETLFGDGLSNLTEAEAEFHTILKRNHTSGVRSTFRDMSEQFQKKPYGWPLNTVQCLLAQLYRKGKVDLRFDGSSLDEQMVMKLLPQSANATSLILRPLEDIDTNKLKKLKDFHHDFFKTSNPGSDYRSVIREFHTALETKINYFKQLGKQQSTYHFLESITPALESLLELKNKDKTALLDDIDIIEQQYMDLAEDKLDDIQSFMEGPQFQVYQEIVEFWQKNRDDTMSFGSENTAAIYQLIQSKQPWSDTQAAKAALEEFRPMLEKKKTATRLQVSSELDELKAQIRYDYKFGKISPEQQNEILKPFDELAGQLKNFHSISTIEAQKQHAQQTIYVQQLNKLAEIKIDGVEPDIVSEKMSVSDKEILVEYPHKLLASEEDLEAYLVAMKEAYQIVIRDNKKIALS
ncbi:MAG: hypothetical protein HOM71_01855, partial [Deltaproteobacteria bacterium]|nr:hypothetical protein [Deltaproteobacteria bacterium]